jgi:ATP-dependent DNA helicase RecG
VFKQTEEAFSYLQLCNKNQSVIEGLTRADFWDYPPDAIREALINAIIHRDYSFSGSIIINVNDKCMEFVSIGGLLPGLTPEDIHSGISLLRNRKLAEVFHRLHFIESYGTGIRRICALYERCTEKPTITVTPNSFKIVLPNINATTGHRSVKSTQNKEVTQQMKELLDYLAVHGEISDDEIQKRLGVKRTRAYTLVHRMRELGLLMTSGRGKNRKHKLNGHKVK